jgi:predicted nicotinamide N-methyase
VIEPRDALQNPHDFVLENTELQNSPLVPEISLHLAHEMLPLWTLTEAELDAAGLPSPYWAFAWAGGQALARFILDTPELVRGRCVLDFATGSGIVGLAAAKSGARRVLANDIDPVSLAACDLNAKANNVSLETNVEDLIGSGGCGWDVILAGDICYEQPLAGHVERWLKGLAAEGALVLMGDPGRTHLPKSGLEKLAEYKVETTRELEDNDVRRTLVWKVCDTAKHS